MAKGFNKYQYHGKRKRPDNYFPAFLLEALRLNVTVTTLEALSAGDFVYLTGSDNINMFAGKASGASGGNIAQGFVEKDYVLGVEAFVILTGTLIEVLTGIVLNTTYFLSDTVPGGITSTMVTGSGKIHQIIGKGISPTTIFVDLGEQITIA